MDVHLYDIFWGVVFPASIFLLILTWRQWWPIVYKILSGAYGALPAHAGAGASSGDAVPVQQHQEEPELVPNFARALTYISQHNFTSDEAADILANMKIDGEYLLSANKIRDIVGGNEAAVKARVASHRPKPAQPRVQGRMERPANGW